MLAIASTGWKEKSFGEYSITEGLILPETLPLSQSGDVAMLTLCDKYYDHALFKRLEKHCREAGMDTMKLGYAYCALPVVLEHNTPNNSIPLLWAETGGAAAPTPWSPCSSGATATASEQMSNPFLRRATEYIRDDSAFLAIVSPEPLTAFVAKHKKRPLALPADREGHRYSW